MDRNRAGDPAGGRTVRGLVAAAIVGLALPVQAQAQAARTPDQRQTLLDLAFVLGEAHALRTVCRGPEDQAWRARMTGMIEVEQPNEAFRRLLVERFNAGFSARRAETLDCLPDAPTGEREAAARGEALARKLGRAP